MGVREKRLGAPLPHSWLSYPGKIQFSLLEAAPWRGPESKGMKLTNSNGMWSLPAGVHNGTEMVGQSTKCFIGSCKPEFNPPECTLKKKKNPTWWHTLVILGPGRQRQWVPEAHWPGSFGEFQANDRTCVKSQGGEHVRSNSRGCPLASTCKHPHSDSHLHRQAPAHSCAHAQKLFFFLKSLKDADESNDISQS